jgi:hypothetical protein
MQRVNRKTLQWGFAELRGLPVPASGFVQWNKQG